MTLLDGWAGDQPQLQAGLTGRRADTSAWHAWNQLDRAIGAVRQALDDDAVGPEWRDQLRSKCLEAGPWLSDRRHADMRYFVKVAGQSISPREAWERAPHRRADWFPAGAPPVEYGAAGVDLVDRVGLERAMAAGKAALAAGYGQARADGLVPCGTCPSCTFGHPEGCRRPQSKAMARLRASHAADADRTRDQVVLAELQALTVELAARLG